MQAGSSLKWFGGGLVAADLVVDLVVGGSFFPFAWPSLAGLGDDGRLGRLGRLARKIAEQGFRRDASTSRRRQTLTRGRLGSNVGESQTTDGRGLAG